MRRRKNKSKRMSGRGNTLLSIATGNQNLAAINALSSPKPPLQPTGQIVNFVGSGRKKRRMRGRGLESGALLDKYGAYVHAF